MGAGYIVLLSEILVLNFAELSGALGLDVGLSIVKSWNSWRISYRELKTEPLKGY